ncbi:MAG: MBL fold metallo-hydrolase, partial [Planctomycetota bacterium]
MPQPIAEFEYAGIRILGFSQAGEESFIVAPELNLAFDVGRAPRETLSVDNILLTHGHMDHAAGVAYYCSQRMFIDAPPGTIYAPEPLIEPINRLLALWGEIDGHIPPAKVVAARPGEDIQLRRDLIARPF